MTMTSGSGRASVASGHPQVTEAASEILRAGGNAFDAVVAAGFVGAVAEPALTSLGGGGFLLARTAQDQMGSCIRYGRRHPGDPSRAR